MWSAGWMHPVHFGLGYTPFTVMTKTKGDTALEMVQRGKFDFDQQQWDDINKGQTLQTKLFANQKTQSQNMLTAQEALEHKWFKRQLKDQKN